MAPRPYHFDSFDPSIRRKLDAELSSLLESNPVIGNAMERKLELTVKCGEHIVELFHHSLVEAHTDQRLVQVPSFIEVMQDIERRLTEARSYCLHENWNRFRHLSVIKDVVLSKYQPGAVLRDVAVDTTGLMSPACQIQPSESLAEWSHAPLNPLPGLTTSSISLISQVTTLRLTSSVQSLLTSPPDLTAKAISEAQAQLHPLGFGQLLKTLRCTVVARLRMMEMIAARALYPPLDAASYKSEPVACSSQSDTIIPTPPTRILETPQPPGIMPEDEFKAMGDFISQWSTETPPSPKIMPKHEIDAMAVFISKYATLKPDLVSEDPDTTR